LISTSDAFAAVQGLLGARVAGRMLLSAAGDPIPTVTQPPVAAGAVCAVVPVLDEERRLGPCLEGLRAQGPWLREILVVDGGSRDGTRDLVAAHAACDERVRFVDASPVPDAWNGKAWGLECGLRASGDAEWILTIDADVRPAPDLTASLLAHAAASGLEAFSAAPRLRLSGAAEALLHPSLLATLVYRYGLPGSVATEPRAVQADGQCFFVRRDALLETNAIAAAHASRCEDVTIARALVTSGRPVGFFEAQQLATVEMYASAAECWDNWPRSLPMHDQFTRPLDLALAFAELALVQAAPLAIVVACLARGDTTSRLFRLNAALAALRLGTLAGMRRAYDGVPLTYWLSPTTDIAAVARIVTSALSREQTWRGRSLVRERGA
jgi:dolichol-phosphate mannosyltransferase